MNASEMVPQDGNDEEAIFMPEASFSGEEVSFEFAEDDEAVLFEGDFEFDLED